MTTPSRAADLRTFASVLRWTADAAEDRNLKDADTAALLKRALHRVAGPVELPAEVYQALTPARAAMIEVGLPRILRDEAAKAQSEAEQIERGGYR